MAQPNTQSPEQSELELMKRHVSALFTHDDLGRLRRVNEPEGAEAPRFFLGRTVAGNLGRCRYDLPERLVEELNGLSLKEPSSTDLRQEPVGFEKYLSLLGEHSPVQRIWNGPSYFFPDSISPPSAQAVNITSENFEVLRPGFEVWIPDVKRRPFLAILHEGSAVSICCSVRITPEAHEAGVETLDAYRGRGYAADVVAQWAKEVRRLGSMPLYSTSWQNIASQGVARKLGLVQYGSDFHVT
jgi:RimJ/RimL family protein N-acetyltransferase